MGHDHSSAGGGRAEGGDVVRVVFACTLDDLSHAVRLLTSSRAARLFAVVSLVAAGVVAVLAIGAGQPVLGVVAAIVVVNALLPPILRRRRVGRLRARVVAPSPDVVATFAADGMEVEDAVGRRRYAWREVVDVGVDDRVLAVRLAGFRVLAVPVAQVSGAALDDVERWRRAGGGHVRRRWRGVDLWQPVVLVAALLPVPGLMPDVGPPADVGTGAAAPALHCEQLDAGWLSGRLGYLVTPFEGSAAPPGVQPRDTTCAWSLGHAATSQVGVVPAGAMVVASYSPASGGSAQQTFLTDLAVPPSLAVEWSVPHRTSLNLPGAQGFEDVSDFGRVLHLLRGDEYVTVRLVMSAREQPRIGTDDLVAVALRALDAVPRVRPASPTPTA